MTYITDPTQPEAHPVAIINNDWAPTLAFALSLGRRKVPLHFYGPGVGRWSRYCRRHARCPPVQQADRFLPWLQARVRSGEISRLAPTTDLIAYYLSVLRDDFPADVRRAISPLSEVERCLLKTRFSVACEAAGQPVPLEAAPDDLDGAVLAARTLGYPVIIKPKSHLVVGSGKRGQLVYNERALRLAYHRYAVTPGQEQLAATYPELCWPLLQQYLPAARQCVYSVSGIKDADRGIVTAILTKKREQWPPDVGISTVQEICNDADILNAGLRTVDRLLSRGLFELELLTDGKRLLAIDLNPRAFGFITLDMAAGNDLPWLWWQTTRGTVEPTPTLTQSSALECRFVIPYYISRAIRRLFRLAQPHPPSDTTRSHTPWVSMLGHRGDPVPMLLAHVRLLHLLPHPHGLLRPYLSAAWRTRHPV